MKWPVVGAALTALAVWGGAATVAAGERPSREGAAPPPVPVTAALAERKAVPVELNAFGTVEANATVAVRAQVTGVITAVSFKEGQEVKKGDLLVLIDPRPFQAALDRAQAALERDQIQLANAEKEAARQAELLKAGAAAQGVYDQAKTAADALAAAARADKAAVESARLDLEYCSIRSPIEGRVGARLVDAGNMVKAGDVALAVINQIRPIQMSFAVPQQKLQVIRERQAKGNLAVHAFLPEGDRKPESPQAEVGELTFIDNAVDRATGTIRIKATFANAAERLWPGQFVNVMLVLEVQKDAVLIPASAVQSGQRGHYVFVIRADGTAEDRPVTVDRTWGDKVVISKGLAGGEQVVTDGQLQLRPNFKVQIKAEPAKPNSIPDPGPGKGGKAGGTRGA